MVQGTGSTYENFYLGHLKRVRQYYKDNELITCHGACLDIVNSSCAPYNIKIPAFRFLAALSGNYYTSEDYLNRSIAMCDEMDREQQREYQQAQGFLADQRNDAFTKHTTLLELENASQKAQEHVAEYRRRALALLNILKEKGNLFKASEKGPLGEGIEEILSRQITTSSARLSGHFYEEI